MSKSYEFLRECGVFFVLTLDQDQPMGRPFGAITEYEGAMYFTTSTKKKVYEQLKANANMQIVALKAGTRNWMRISGKAIECKDLSIKQILFNEHPFLVKRYGTIESEEYAVFEVSDKKAYLNTDQGIIKVD